MGNIVSTTQQRQVKLGEGREAEEKRAVCVSRNIASRNIEMLKLDTDVILCSLLLYRRYILTAAIQREKQFVSASSKVSQLFSFEKG